MDLYEKEMKISKAPAVVTLQISSIDLIISHCATMKSDVRIYRDSTA